MTRFLLAFLIVPVALTLGCSTTRSKEAADREVYGLVDEKRELVAGTPEEFDIAPPEAWDPLANTATVESKPLPRRRWTRPAQMCSRWNRRC